MNPLAEKYYSISPYAYCLNNPLKYIDPDGRDPFSLKDWRQLGKDVWNATKAAVSVGMQVSAKVELGTAKVGVDANLASRDMAGIKDGELFHPGDNFDKSEIKQGVSVDASGYGVGIEKVVVEDKKGNLSRETTLSGNALVFEGSATTTTEIIKNRAGTYGNGESTKKYDVKAKNIGFKAGAVVVVDVKFDTEKLAKAITDFFKKD